MIMNKEKFESLPADLQKMLADIALRVGGPGHPDG